MFNLPRALIDAEDARDELITLMEVLNECTNETVDKKLLDEILSRIEDDISLLREQVDEL